MVIYTPLNLPRLEPDNWEIFWNIWNTHSNIAVKKSNNLSISQKAVGANDVWRGLDIFKNLRLEPSWDCPYFDISKELPRMYESIMQLNLKTLFRVRLIQSIIDIPSHTDNNIDKWNIRGFLHYTDTKSQWFFTKPNCTARTYAQLPDDTQWFAYNDRHAWHGTDYNPDHKKILIQLYFLESIDQLVKSGISQYNDYIIDFT